MPTQLLPLSAAESIIAAFFDPEIANQIPFRFASLGAAGCRSQGFWCYTFLQWDDCTPGAEAARLEVDCEVPAGRWDRVMLCAMLPTGVGWRLQLRIDGAWRDAGSGRGTGARAEIETALPRGRLDGVAVVLTAQAAGRQRIALNWIGLADSALRSGLLAARPAWEPSWPGLLRSDPGEVRFARGLLFAAEDLPRLRAKAQRPDWNACAGHLISEARALLARQPEADIDEHLPWYDYRYIRERERGRQPFFTEALEVGLAGLITGDAALQRQAVRYLLSMCACRSWEPSAECHAGGSTWDQRCFSHELTASAVALLADWYDWMLTDRARGWVRKVLYDQGLAVIERDMMRWEYVHHINQGPWFCRALVLGGLLLESSWPRMGDYADRAWRWMVEGMDRYLLPDGGTDEGAGYFTITLHAVLPAGLAYARARGRKPLDCLPRALALADRYAATASAMRPGDTLMDGDNSAGWWFGDTVAIMAALQPGRCWDGMLAPVLAQRLGREDYYRPYVAGALSLVLGPETVPPPRCVVPEFSLLPITGLLSSCRRDGARSLRLTLSGAKANASHTHLDKGAVTCEADGVPLLIDPGQLRYDDLRCDLMKRTSLHNCLTPAAQPWPDQAPPQEAVIPQGLGDARSLLARIDLTPLWRTHFAAIRRELASDSIDAFALRDAGELLADGAVVLHLFSRSPWSVARGVATTVVEGRSLTVDAAWAADMVEAERWIDHRREPLHHLAITSRPLRSFDLTTTCTIGR